MGKKVGFAVVFIDIKLNDTERDPKKEKIKMGYIYRFSTNIKHAET